MDTTASAPLVRVDGEAEASVDGMDAVHGLLARYWVAAQEALPSPPDGPWKALFDLAVVEIAANIVRHAYPAWETRATFRLSLRCFPDHMEALLIDRGVPYVPPHVVARPDMSEAVDVPDLDHGWGLPIIHAAVDRIEYEHSPEGENRWRIDKRMPS